MKKCNVVAILSLSFFLLSCRPQFYSIPRIIDLDGHCFILTDTIKKAIVLKINTKKCDSNLYASGINIRTLNEDTLLIHHICFDAAIASIGDTVNVMPSERMQKKIIRIGNPIGGELTNFDKKSYRYCYGKIFKTREK